MYMYIYAYICTYMYIYVYICICICAGEWTAGIGWHQGTQLKRSAVRPRSNQVSAPQELLRKFALALLPDVIGNATSLMMID